MGHPVGRKIMDDSDACFFVDVVVIGHEREERAVQTVSVHGLEKDGKEFFLRRRGICFVDVISKASNIHVSSKCRLYSEKRPKNASFANISFLF
jgi:hypothetical protein